MRAAHKSFIAKIGFTVCNCVMQATVLFALLKLLFLKTTIDTGCPFLVVRLSIKAGDIKN